MGKLDLLVNQSLYVVGMGEDLEDEINSNPKIQNYIQSLKDYYNNICSTAVAEVHKTTEEYIKLSEKHRELLEKYSKVVEILEEKDSKLYHCEYCMCPTEIWKPTLTTYNGDECKLYHDFINLVDDIGDSTKHFNNQDIMNKCYEIIKDDFPDIPDFEATINELINVRYSEGYMPTNYKPFSVCR